MDDGAAFCRRCKRSREVTPFGPWHEASGSVKARAVVCKGCGATFHQFLGVMKATIEREDLRPKRRA
jgi:hypothetical protein